MPFDGQEVTPRLRRQILIDALRKEMPKGFTWDYETTRWDGKCGTSGCAVGVASLIWPNNLAIESAIFMTETRRFAEFLGMSEDDTLYIFYEMPKDTTPEQVAEALEALD